MTSLRVLHVDDEPDIRELVEISLGLDPELSVKSCSSGGDALTAAAEWSPDLILMDVMMPVMDGPQTLGHLRERQTTAEIPVIFMTARAQTRELAQFLSLGAAGVIAKPFDPMTLAGAVRSYLHISPAAFEGLKRRFVARARSDALALATLGNQLRIEPEAAHAQVDRVAHALLGAAGVHGFAAVGAAAQDLARAVENARNGIGSAIDVEEAVDRLIAVIASDCRNAPAG